MDPKNALAGTERRFYEDKPELRQEGDKRKCKGYAMKFNRKSSPIFGMFQEKIAPGALDGADMADVRAYFNHDRNLILGRTTSATLRLTVDEVGLAYEIDLPDTQAGKDLAVSLQRGDVTQSSFAFEVEEDEWDEDIKPALRTIKKFRRIRDVSPVTEPQYQDTSAGLRCEGIALETTEKMLEIANKKNLRAIELTRLETILRTM